MLKLLARNAEANSHLFAIGGSPTPAKASATTSADSSGSSSGGGVGDFAAEGDKTCGGGGGVVAVRELDWFTFSREEGSAVAANCDPAEEVREVG